MLHNIHSVPLQHVFYIGNQRDKRDIHKRKRYARIINVLTRNPHNHIHTHTHTRTRTHTHPYPHTHTHTQITPHSETTTHLWSGHHEHSQKKHLHIHQEYNLSAVKRLR